MPVDVGHQGDAAKAPTPLDDYWLHRPRLPRDQKWGTLTVAATKLAERRAAQQQQQQQAQLVANNNNISAPLPLLAGRHQQAEVDSLAGELPNLSGSRTLPRWFGTGVAQIPIAAQQPPPPDDNNDDDDGRGENQSQLQLDCWLRQQLQAAAAAAAAAANDPMCPPPHQQRSSGAGRPLPAAAFHQAPHHYQLAAAAGPHQRSLSQVEPPAWRLQPLLPSSQADLQRLAWHHQRQLACQPQSQQQQQQLMLARNSPFRSTLPLAFAAPQQQQPAIWRQLGGHVNNKSPQPPAANLLHLAAAPQNLATDVADAAAERDDVVVDAKNACLGSYKRKRRLPHIEAQFTIRTPASLNSDNNNRWPDHQKLEQQHSHHHQQQPAAAASTTLEDGHLFVRSLPAATDHAPQPARRRRSPPPPPLPTPPPPVGMPSPGQRREWRRLRPGPPLSQVPNIGAREKIETYLRHYDQQQQQQQSYGSKTGSGHRDIGADLEAAVVTPLEGDDELTFQPYHNLPSLKYSIRLPLEQAHDGRLLLAETSHLRRSRRHRSSGAARSAAASETARRRRKHRLGSSSSCPAPPGEFCQGSSNSEQQTSLLLSHSSRSLESASRGATTLTRLATELAPPDSLESVEQPATNSSDENNRQPFYLRSPSPPPDDYSSLRETLGGDNHPQEAIPAPPPVPPHRTSEAQVQTEDTSKEEEEEEEDRSHQSSSHCSPNGSQRSADTNRTNGDHSVDENYEFDLVSSCSSSTRLRPSQAAQSSPARRTVNDQLYTEVNKKVLVKERSRFYDFAGRRKEQPLSAGGGGQPEQAGDYYDTVYDATSNSNSNNISNENK